MSASNDSLCLPYEFLHFDIHEAERLLTCHFVADGFREHDSARAVPKDIRYFLMSSNIPSRLSRVCRASCFLPRNYQTAESCDILFRPDRNDLNISLYFLGGGAVASRCSSTSPLIGEYPYPNLLFHIICRARREAGRELRYLLSRHCFAQAFACRGDFLWVVENERPHPLSREHAWRGGCS